MREQFYSEISLAVLLFFLPASVNADMSVSLVRDTCIPEFAYHKRETKESSILAAAIAHGFESFDDEARNKRLRLLADNDLYLPDVVAPVCTVPVVNRESQRPISHKERNLPPLLRVVCIPALRYLEIDLVQDADLLEAVSAKTRTGNVHDRSSSLKVLAARNLHLADAFNYSCAMPETTYKITTKSVTSSQGHGGGNRFIGFDLQANRQLWFKELRIAPVSGGQALLTSITISDGKQGWTPYREVILCLNENGLSGQRCDDMRFRLAMEEELGQIEKPITQESLVPQPSFDCGRASTRTEKVVCANPELRKLDHMLGDYYQQSNARLNSHQRDALRAQQRQWLKQRDTNCAPSDLPCLSKAYKERIRALWIKYENQVAFRVTIPGTEGSVHDGSFGRCDISDVVQFKDFVIYAGGGYSGRPLSGQIDDSGFKATQFDVVVNSPKKPAVLVLGSYEPAIWNVSWTPETKILAVFASGYHRQAVAGIPEKIPVVVTSSDNYGPCKFSYIDNRKFTRPGEGFDPARALRPAMQMTFGRKEDGLYFADFDGGLRIGEPVANGERLVSSRDILLEQILSKTTPLSGEEGLQYAIAKGLIRLATEEDKKDWIKRRALLQPPQDPTQPWKDGSIPLQTKESYVILKPFQIPKGVGVQVFFLAENVPAPEGNLGHAVLYDFNDMSCRGIICNLAK